MSNIKDLINKATDKTIKLKIKHRIYQVPAIEGASNEKTFELDRSAKSILGIAVVATIKNQAFLRGSQEIKINGSEVLPTGYPTELLMTNPGVSVNEKFYDLGDIDPGNFELRINYKDTDHPDAAFEDYTVSYIVLYQI